MNCVVIALGSNIDPDANIQKACAALAREFKVKAASSLTRTKPLGFAEQADFLNGVILIETGL